MHRNRAYIFHPSCWSFSTYAAPHITLYIHTHMHVTCRGVRTSRRRHKDALDRHAAICEFLRRAPTLRRRKFCAFLFYATQKVLEFVCCLVEDATFGRDVVGARDAPTFACGGASAFHGQEDARNHLAENAEATHCASPAGQVQSLNERIEEAENACMSRVLIDQR